MKRNKKGSMPEITRNLYKSVKKFDRQRFTEFCTELYKYGYEDGRGSVPGIDVEAVLSTIAGIKGIGSRRLKEIKTGLDCIIENQNSSELIREN